MLPDLMFRITAQGASAAAFAKTKGELRGIRGELAGLSAAGRAFIGSIGAGLGIGALATLPGIIGDIAAEGARLGTTAAKIGVTVEELQKLRYAGEGAEISAGQVDEAFAKFSLTMGEAARGGADQFRQALELNGIALFDNEGKLRKVIDVAMDYANVIRNAANASDRNVLSTIGFSKKNDEMGQFFANGAQGIRAFGDELERNNGVTSAVDVQKLADIDAAYDKLGATWRVASSNAVLLGASIIQMYEDTQVAATNDLVRNPNLANLARAALGFDLGGVSDATIRETSDFPQADTPRTTDDLLAALGMGKPSKVPPAAGSGSATERATEKFKTVIDALELQRDNLERTDREQEIYNQLARAGVEIDTERGGVIAQLAGETYDLEQSLNAANEASQFFADTTFAAFDALIPKINTGNSALDNFLNTLIQTAAQALLLGQGPLAGLFGTASGTTGVVGGLLGSAFGIPGFASGGSMIAGGSGGPDSQLMMARVTPGERIDFTPPGGPQPQSGPSRIEIAFVPTPELDARITRVSGPVAVQVVSAAGRRQQRAQELGD